MKPCLEHKIQMLRRMHGMHKTKMTVSFFQGIITHTAVVLSATEIKRKTASPARAWAFPKGTETA